MKKILFLVGLILLAVAGRVYAHPPFQVDVAYDKATGIASATIMHLVRDPATHYIFKVEVSVNGKVIQEGKFDHQQDSEQQKVTFEIPGLKSGDEITVVVYCNLSGGLGTTIKVE